MVDFIEEVEEQLRSDRYVALARRTWPWFAALAVAIIVGLLGVWAYQTWQGRQIAKASIAYDKALNELAQGDPTGAYTDFEPIARSGPAGYRMLALMQQGNIRLGDGKSADASRLFDDASKAAPNPTLRDLASLRAALALLDTAPYPQMQTRLSTLIGDKKPFDLEAREALAMAKLEAGKYAEARSDFNALTLTLGVSQAMRQRAQAAVALIDSGQAPAAVAAARAAAALPPLPPGALQSMLSAPASNTDAGATTTQDQAGAAQ